MNSNFQLKIKDQIDVSLNQVYHLFLNLKLPFH